MEKFMIILVLFNTSPILVRHVIYHYLPFPPDGNIILLHFLFDSELHQGKIKKGCTSATL